MSMGQGLAKAAVQPGVVHAVLEPGSRCGTHAQTSMCVPPGRRGGSRGLAPVARLTVLVLLILVGGCRDEQTEKTDLVSDTAARGPIRFTVQAGPRDVTVGDPITVDLIAEAPGDYEVQLPAAEAFGELAAREIETLEPRPGASGVVWRRSFEVEPLVSGPLEIPPLTVTYTRQTGASETQPAPTNELETQALELEVRSVLTEADGPTQPRDITGTLLPPKPPLELSREVLQRWAVWIGITAIVLALVAYAGYRTWRWYRRPPPPILPELWALQALAELRGSDWVENGRFREYYYRLTEIVRGYIERKFSLAAPEMTTEEFLTMLARDRQALPYDAERLGRFLEACDIVKYAAFRPRREDAEEATSTALAFVHATAAAVATADAARAASRSESGGDSTASGHPRRRQSYAATSDSGGSAA